MRNTIDFGIDLGTTNSVISRYDGKNITIYKNPRGLKQTLPSVVAYRRERILVGDKAIELLEKDPSNVVGLFKRKMGTSESYYIENLENTVTPIDLSSVVLKELKNFVLDTENIEDIVITIPASFDTVQSNATKEAGLKAGFKEVILLQEPIAASLAFVNTQEENAEGNWLIYDLGGGTFDVALVNIDEGEMNITDHAGDNFLGGTDFDLMLIESLIIPELEKKGDFNDFETQLKSAAGKYNKIYFELLYKAEQVKIELSSEETSEIELEIEDDNGNFIDFFLTIDRITFNKVIKYYVDKSIGLIDELIQQNSIQYKDLNGILLIGGSTYIPYVRERLNQHTNIPVRFDIDPTTAVAVGAAYYAGSKNKSIKKTVITKEEPINSDTKFEIKAAFQKQTHEPEEYFVAKIVEGDEHGVSYRITRLDGGFDSGLKPLTKQFEEDLPLQTNNCNEFIFQLFNEQGDRLESNFSAFSITHGNYGVLGQPLPADILLEVDDIEEQETMLEVIFEKNQLLPLKKVFTKEVGQTIKAGTNESFVINILEGKQQTTPSANKPIGIVRIDGSKINRDLLKGTDVEITVEMTESRELKVYTYLSMTGQEFENVFTPNERLVDVQKLKSELKLIYNDLTSELSEAEVNENYETAATAKDLLKEIENLIHKVNKMSDDDVTDTKYQCEDRKRIVAFKYESVFGNKKNEIILQEYKEWKTAVYNSLEEFGSEKSKGKAEEILSKEKSVLVSGNKSKIKSLTDKWENLWYEIKWEDPEHIKSLYYYASWQEHSSFSNPVKAKKLIEKGEKIIEKENINELKALVNELYAMLPDNKKNGNDFGNRTGLV